MRRIHYHSLLAWLNQQGNSQKTLLLKLRHLITLFAVLGIYAQVQAFTPEPPLDDVAGNLLFSKAQINVSSVVNGTVRVQNNTLRASTGTANGITLTNLTNATWLTLPTAPASVSTTVTILDFSINPTGLTEGVYTATVRAEAPSYTAANFTIILSVSGINSSGTTDVRINFRERTTATPPAGWIFADSSRFNLRTEVNQGGGQYTFGWTTSNGLAVPNGVNRTCTSFSLEERTLIFMHNAGANPQVFRIWEIAVPNGLYEVTVSVGDGTDNQNVTHNLNVEGVNAINQFNVPGTTPTCTAARFRTATVTVYVGDGRLTLDPYGGISTRINSVIIKPATARLVFTPPALQISVPFGESIAPVPFNIKPNFGDAEPVTLTKSDNSDWLTLSTVDANGDATASINIDGLVVGNYQAFVTASSPGYPDVLMTVDLAVLPRSMNFTPSVINLNSFYEQAIAPQVATISGNFDNPLPEITLTKTAGTPWLILPDNPEVNQPLTFSFDPTGLPPGLHQATVTASAEGYQNATLTFNLTVQPYGLNFSASTLNFQVTQGQTTVPQNINLTAAIGTPPVLLTKSAGATWLVMPTPALGSLAFGIDAGGLEPGIYFAQVNANAPGYTSTSLTVRLEVLPNLTNITWVESINFQRHNVSPFTLPTGFKADNGAGYGGTNPPRGWVNPANGQPINNFTFLNPGVSQLWSDEEKLNRTWNYLNNPVNGFYIWEVGLPNGLYNALISVGDPNVVAGVHRVNIEGVNAIDDFVPSNEIRQKIGLVTVNVTDGKLTLDAGEGGSFVKLNYIRTGLANPATDVIPPTIKIKFNDLSLNQLSSESFNDQVLVEAETRDVGGSGVALVEFSINGGAFQPYNNALLINQVGNYTIQFRATDGNGNQSLSPITPFSVIRAVRSNAKLGLYNLDRFPDNENLTFSLIQIPWKNIGPNFAASHNKVTLRMRNAGSATLRIDNLIFSDATKWKIETLGGSAYNPTVMLPILLAPGQFVDAVVEFIANYPDGQAPPGSRNDRVGVLHETLTIVSNDDDEPNKEVYLHGLWQRRGEGSNEPTLNEIFDALGMKTAAGFSPSKAGNNAAGFQPTGDEIFSANWVRADLTRPVYVRQVAAYHGCCSGGANIRYNKPGVKGGSIITSHTGVDGQSLLPRANVNGTPAERSFVPAPGFTSEDGRFNFTLVNDCTDPALNLNGWVGVRIFKARDAKGNIIPNAYFMSMDYLSNQANWDYNDNTFYIENIKPAEGTAYVSVLSPSIEEIAYPTRQVGASDNFTVTLTNLGQIYNPGPNDPAITIQSVRLAGDNFEDFQFVLPNQRTLTATQSTNITVTFSPKTAGAKKAELLVYYNAGNTALNTYSPLRIPLYGVAETACVNLDLMRKIKSAAPSTAPVMINGEAWESDAPFRKGSIRLDVSTPPIRNTERDDLYSTYLSSSADLRSVQYQIPLAPGSYKVRLHFAENFFDRVGSRVNNIFIENVLRLPGYDIFEDVKFKTAVSKDFDVILTDGLLDINFVPTVNRPAVCGIEIFRFNQNASALGLVLDSSIPANCSASDGSLTVLATGAATNIEYKLGQFGIYQSSGTFDNLAAGEYVLYARDADTNCEVSQVFVLEQANNTVDFTLDLTPVSCNSNNDGRARVVFTGGDAPYNVIWNNNPELTTTTIVNLPVANNHTITVTDANGCTKTVTFSIGITPGCPLRINAGGGLYIANNGRQFVADQNFSGGSTFTQTATLVTGTANPTLYNSERTANSFSYNIPIANGTYAVRLHFAEIRNGINSGGRIFNVDVEGLRRLSNYDIAEQIGPFTAIVETINTTVSDNTLNILFTGVVNAAKVSAIEIIPINVVNVAPVVGTFANRTVPRDTPFSFSFPLNTFTDPGDLLTYTARLANGNPLPNWISFDPTSRTFSTFANVPVGTVIMVRLTAIDSYGLTATLDFSVTVNEIPVLSQVQVNQNIRPVAAGNNRYVLGVELNAGTNTTLQATQFDFSTQGTNKTSAVSQARLYYTGNNSDFRVNTTFGVAVNSPDGAFSFTGTQNLAAGVNYFWLVYDINEQAAIGDLFDATFDAVVVSSEIYTPAESNPLGERKFAQTSGNAGNAYDFQGSNNFLEIKGNVSWTPQFTMEFWYSPNENPTTEKWILGETNGTRITQLGNTLRFYISNSLGQLQGPATMQLPNFNNPDVPWHHVAAVFNGTTFNLVINGVSGTPVSFVGSNAYLGNAIRIGAANAATQNDFLLDELRIWDNALSLTNIRKQMHLTLTGNEPGLRHYWQFDEAEDAQEILDLVGDTYAARSNPTITNWVTAIQPVGRGVSHAITVNTAGNYDFTGTGLNITFGAITPNAEIVVTRLFNKDPYEKPSEIITLIEQAVNDGRPKSDDYWLVNNFGTAVLSPMTLRFNISEALYNFSTDANAFWLHKRPTFAISNWEDERRGTLLGGTAGNRFVQFSGTQSFSLFVITAGGSTPLPVSLLSFTATKIAPSKNKLAWVTVTESDNQGFEIEKSFDAINFTKIGFVEGAGDSFLRLDYEFTDEQASQSAYYRLKQIDFSGTFSYSSVVFVEGNKEPSWVLYPNPVIDKVSILVGEDDLLADDVILEMSNLQGISILKAIGTVKALEEKLNETVQKLSSGVYLCRFSKGNRIQTLRLVKVN